MTPAGIGPRLGASLVTSISGSDCGQRKIYSCEFQSALPCLLTFISQVVNYCAAGIIPGQWSPVGQRKIFQVLALCSVPTFLDQATGTRSEQGGAATSGSVSANATSPSPLCHQVFTDRSQPTGGLDMSHGPLSKMPECLGGSRHNGTALVWHLLWYVADFGVRHMELVVASFS